MNFEDIQSLMIPFPPAETQERFSEAMAQLERHEEKAQASLNTTASLFSSLQHRAFRGEL